ncbi:hypothetical protein GOBAR_AA27513 [Gossypium barbadense]|uniref:NB-ARC domain-containing protein n=1 Tax=Gossypium barbadense TaxID=3634 RepID=A0A2P5WPZ6_GOSBA|nr:hypothetical protein GOBAR_AA27513 [Gossypium barbadense]
MTLFFSHEDTDSRMNAELQPRKKLKTEVQIWLENVERINGKVQKLNEQIGESITLTRGFHADDVLKRTREVEELIQQGKFQEGLVVDHPQWIEQVLSITTLSGESAKACLEEIWQCLMDDEVGKVGVWGMGGVGKTSIMKLINNQLLKEMGKFHIVIWITVSKDKSISKLQKDMESKIGISFCVDEDEITRAGMLFETLSRKSGLVMILDDIWEEVSLEKVGIPEPSTGSKIVLTTRSFDVCRKMSCRAIKVKPLVEKESWKLFSEKVGRDIPNAPGVEPIAKKVAKRCGGLPLGELSEHKQSVNGLEDEVFQQLRRLVKEMDSRQAKFDRGHAIMNKLLSNCLLEVCQGSGNKRSIRMHDLSEYLEKVPLIWNRELEVLYPLEMSPPKCPMLTTLFLSGCGIKSIPEGFFNHMDGLKILKLSLNPIKSFPNSISNLNNLTALLLAYCDHLEYVPSLSKLGVLKELDLRGTKIKEVPHGMQNLSILKELVEQAGTVFEVANTIRGLVENHWEFPKGIDQNVNNLKRKRDELNGQKEDVESRIKSELRTRKKVKKEVDLWIENVKRINGEIPNLESKVRGSSFFPRGFLVKNVRKKEEEVEELLEKGRFSDDLVVNDLSWIGQVLPTPSLVVETIKCKKNEIMQHLRNDEVQKIGVYGMPGVGKTSVVTLVNNELLKGEIEFKIIVWVTVARNCSVIELQNKIAKAMNVSISEDEDETLRAGMLSEILSEKGRFVLILDDVWEILL